MNEIIPMPVIVEEEEYDYCEEESAAEVIGSLLAGVDGMEWKDDTLIKHNASKRIFSCNCRRIDNSVKAPLGCYPVKIGNIR